MSRIKSQSADSARGNQKPPRLFRSSLIAAATGLIGADARFAENLIERLRRNWRKYRRAPCIRRKRGADDSFRGDRSLRQWTPGNVDCCYSASGAITTCELFIKRTIVVYIIRTQRVLFLFITKVPGAECSLKPVPLVRMEDDLSKPICRFQQIIF